MRIKTGVQLSAIVMMSALMSACGSGETDDEEDFEFDGYFTGTITPDGSAAIPGFLYVAQNGDFYINALPKAQFAGEGEVNGTAFSATGMGASAGFANGNPTASFTFSGNVTAGGGALAGSYSGGNESGMYSFQWNGTVSSRAASLSAIAGTYRFPEVGNQLYTLTITTAGAFSFSSLSGCTMTGQIGVLDADWNYYSWQATPSACSGITGTISGHGWMTTATTVYLFGVHSNLPIFVQGTK